MQARLASVFGNLPQARGILEALLESLIFKISSDKFFFFFFFSFSLVLLSQNSYTISHGNNAGRVLLWEPLLSLIVSVCTLNLLGFWSNWSLTFRVCHATSLSLSVTSPLRGSTLLQPDATRIVQKASDLFSHTREQGRVVLCSADVALERGDADAAISILHTVSEDSPFCHCSLSLSLSLSHSPSLYCPHYFLRLLS